jgi:hypothetical protein
MTILQKRMNPKIVSENTAPSVSKADSFTQFLLSSSFLLYVLSHGHILRNSENQLNGSNSTAICHFTAILNLVEMPMLEENFE